jgi:hypothetical protein
MYVRREFSGVPHIHSVEEEIRLRFQMHHRDFDRHQDRRRFEDDVIGMCMEVMTVEGRYRRNEAMLKHKANTAAVPSAIDDGLRGAFDELRQQGLKKIGRIRLQKKAQQRIARRAPNKRKRNKLCKQITVHIAERWLAMQRDMID